MHHFGARRYHEGGRSDMGGAAIPATAIVNLPGVPLQIVNEFGDILRGNGRMDDADVMHLRKHRDMRDPVDGIILQVLVERGIDAQRAYMPHANGIAIGRGAGNLGRARRSAGARTIIHNHALAPRGVELLADDARQNIGRATGGEGNDEGDGSGGPGLLSKRTANAGASASQATSQ